MGGKREERRSSDALAIAKRALLTTRAVIHEQSHIPMGRAVRVHSAIQQHPLAGQSPAQGCTRVSRGLGRSENIPGLQMGSLRGLKVCGDDELPKNPPVGLWDYNNKQQHSSACPRRAMSTEKSRGSKEEESPKCPL